MLQEIKPGHESREEKLLKAEGLLKEIRNSVNNDIHGTVDHAMSRTKYLRFKEIISKNERIIADIGSSEKEIQKFKDFFSQ